jgi:large subunit ribosomal protein L23
VNLNNDRIYKIILAPIVSEKASRLTDKNRQFVFEVASSATKPQIKSAVEQLFKVEVDGVSILNVKAKAKRRGAINGYRKGWKKAIVSLKDGHDINFAETENAGK